MKWSGLWALSLIFGAVCFVCAGEAAGQDRGSEPRRLAGIAEADSDPLAEQVEEAIRISRRRPLTAGVHTPWQVIHGILAFREEFELKQQDQDERISALDWMADRSTFRGRPLFETTRYGGRAHPYTEPYIFEGHPNQFLAIFAMANLPRDYEFRPAGGGTITIADIVKNAQMEVNSHDEPTWTLWALSHYLDSDERWTNKYGETWSIERLVQMQTRDSVYSAACGGTHGLFALSYARNAHLQSGGQLRGVWLEAHQKIQRYIEEARALQNSDGSFSASYFQGRQMSNDFGTRVSTTGHTLEFLMMALPQHRLEEEWLRRSVAVLANDLIENRRSPADCGPLYHAVHGLILYRQRTRPAETAAATAENEPETKSQSLDEAVPSDKTAAAEEEADVEQTETEAAESEAAKSDADNEEKEAAEALPALGDAPIPE